MNKRIQHFLQLTESNIHGTALPQTQDKKLKLNLRTRWQWVVFGLFLLCALIYLQLASHVVIHFLPGFRFDFRYDNAAKNISQAASVKSRPNAQTLSSPSVARYLKSYIPVFYQAAVRQYMQAVPLRRAELQLLADPNAIIEKDMVVMDKVIIMPQQISSTVRRVV